MPPEIEINQDLLERFANGMLGADQEQRIIAYLERHPRALAELTSASSDQLLEKLRAIKSRVDSKSSQGKAELVHSVAVKKQSAQGVQTENTPKALADYPGYTIIKELGRGGMGVVYLAKNVPMDRLEVLKVLNERLLNHAGAKERFLREIRAVSKLNHPAIVTSYSILQLDNLIVFAMEFVNGMDLHKLIQKYRVLPVALACTFARQLASGLQHAYEKKLVHRDIKPSNAIVYKSDGQMQLKILDFGLAKASSEEAAAGLTQDGTLLGTPEYMSPEQILNAAKADIRADIYSLGCTLYHMLTGRPPFVGTHGEVIIAHSQREPQAVNLLRPEVPLELVSVIGKMLAKDPAKRYQLPSEVHAALAPFLSVKAKGSNSIETHTAETSTVNDLKPAERDTSVDGFTPAASLDFSQLNLAPLSLPASVRGATPVLQSPYQPARKKAPPPAWLTTSIIFASVVGVLGLIWLLGVFFFQTPEGTIVIEQMPKDAEVEIDGQEMTVIWNAGHDTAIVTIDAGSHMLKVVNQGNVIHGQQLTVKGGDRTSVKLSLLASKQPAPTASPVEAPSQPTEPNEPSPDLIAAAPMTSATDSEPMVPQPEPQPEVTEPKDKRAEDINSIPTPVAKVPVIRSLFNGVNLDGWRGRPEANPQSWQSATAAEQTAWNAEVRKTWSIEKGELVMKGKGIPLTTEDDFRDIDLLVEYKAKPRSDSGINLRGTPQVQIWDWTDPQKFAMGADRGSGGLYNNDSQAAGRHPLVRADNPFGQWNKLRIIQVGAITSVWLNDKLVVDKARMSNHWEPKRPLPDVGPIQLQAFSGELRFRTILVREVDAAEASSYLRAESASQLALPEWKIPNRAAANQTVIDSSSSWQTLFDGQSLQGWKGLEPYWSVSNGVIIGRFDASNKPKANTALVWEGGAPANFEFETDCRLLGKGNSGVHVRSEFLDPAIFSFRGYQADFESENKFTGIWYEEAGRSILADRGTWTTMTAAELKQVASSRQPVASAGINPNDWCRLRVVASGPNLTYYVNGLWMSHVVDQSAKGKASGLLGLQLHHREPMEVHFRNLRLRDLSQATAPSFASGSTWVGNSNGAKVVLEVNSRTGDEFQAVLNINKGIRREIRGNVRQGVVQWLAKDVKAIQGSAGGENLGTVSAEGDKIDFVWHQDQTAGAYTLSRQ